jgi:hypothetical protein
MPFFFFHSNGSESFEPRIESGKGPTPRNSDIAHDMNWCARYVCEEGAEFRASKNTRAPISEKGPKD